jgi:DNA-binding NtrC family response regulator
VQGIIRGHRGVMRVNSKPNKGTSFEVLFPVSPPRAKPVTAATRAAASSDNYLILVVDDEEGIREAACDILTHHGFQVLSVENGEKAIALCQKHIDEISLILLDMTMPTLSGMETLKILQQQQLNLPVVLMSGYDEQTIDSFKPPTNVVGFLKKPFRMEKLVDTINAALRS